jgi:hypothetical protein
LGLFGKKKSEDGSFKCQYCNMKFDSDERRKRHERKAHSEKGGDMPNMNPFGFS